LFFPNDQGRFNEIKYFMRMILSKKVNQRNCNFGKLRSSEIFDDFDWDGLMDFKLKAPYVPEVVDWSKMLNVKNTLYENVISVNLIFNW
jgi:hypothetical protein